MSCVNRWQMTRIITSPDLEPVLSLDEAKIHLRIDDEGSPPGHPDDTLIESFITGAINELDGIDGWLGRALVTQQWSLSIDWFPEWEILLPLPPLQSVESVVYVDRDGVDITLDPANYRVIASDSDPGRIEPDFGKCWPCTRQQSNAVTISFTCGYGAPSNVPEIIRNYIRLRVGQLYEHRELVAIGVSVAPVPYLRDSLESYRRRVRAV